MMSTIRNGDNKQNDEAKFAEAITLRDKGKFREALNIVKQLLPKYANKPALLAVAAHLYWELENLEMAIRHFRSAIHLSPKSEAISLGLFHCLWQLGKKKEALEEAERFMSIAYSKDYAEIIDDIHSITSKR